MSNGDLGRLMDRLDHFRADPDERLLARFLEARDERSFDTLVRRHGPMILGVCRRLLRHQQDAEDCFQATFIILARKASSVLKRASLASWLHGVAYRTAQQVRCLNARRRTRERQVTEMPQPAINGAEPQDWRPVLDEELDSLPEKYKSALLLCDLEGRPRRDTAELLGIPEGTLSSRLATARKLLAARLSRRGVALSSAALMTILSNGAASAAVPSSLLCETSKAAVLAAAGQLTANASAAAVLTQEVMKTMFLTKLKVTVAGVLVALALSVAGIAYHQTGVSAVQAADGKGVETKAGVPKAPNDLEALRRENELLKLNLRVTLEKLEALETALKQQTEKKAATDPDPASTYARLARLRQIEGLRIVEPREVSRPIPMADLEAAIKAVKEAKDEASLQKAIKALDEALHKFREGRPTRPPLMPSKAQP